MIAHKALSVRQPWAQLIIDGIKPVENRTWSTDYRGPLLIHAALKRFDGYYPSELLYGYVIGMVDLVDVVTEHRSRYFSGPFGWVLKNPRALHPLRLRGQLSLFEVRARLRLA